MQETTFCFSRRPNPPPPQSPRQPAAPSTKTRTSPAAAIVLRHPSRYPAEDPRLPTIETSLRNTSKSLRTISQTQPPTTPILPQAASPRVANKAHGHHYSFTNTSLRPISPSCATCPHRPQTAPPPAQDFTHWRKRSHHGWFHSTMGNGPSSDRQFYDRYAGYYCWPSSSLC